MESIAHDLLIDVATDLFDESQRVPGILSGKRSNATRDRVPHYILTQGVTHPSDFQLPEPILHPILKPEVLAVGYYPNLGEDEDIPRLGCSFDNYVDFYAERFSSNRRDSQGRPAHRRLSDGRNVAIRHYNVVEKLIDAVLGQDQSFGTAAVYCDTVPWKSKSGPSFNSTDGEIAFKRLDQIILTLEPRVVLALGSKSRDVLAHNQRNAEMTNGTLEVPLVISPHPAARGNLFGKKSDEVQIQLANVLGR